MKITVNICKDRRRKQPAMAIASNEQASRLVRAILDDMAPWPEHVIVAPPRFAPLIDYDDLRFTLPRAAITKLWHIRDDVRDELHRLGVMHQMPDVQLLTADGAAATLWGGCHRYQVEPGFLAELNTDPDWATCA